ncbi:hypothetical protein [Gemmatimonas phototrophica]|uniref:hypothetical protein n=1 Tax=Gemmatimonas phototrophica TaxID=1379270 RepID=UPI0011AE2EA1|nr:hypothetical protein [Gemmatimonas phototrophica]
MPGRWSWTDAYIFIAVISALQISMFLLLTKVYLVMLPEGAQCPVCDGDTLAVQRKGWRRFLGFRVRYSWCTDCGWEGMHRRSDAWMAAHRKGRRWGRQTPASMTNSLSQSGQLPLNSKKSS